MQGLMAGSYRDSSYHVARDCRRAGREPLWQTADGRVESKASFQLNTAMGDTSLSSVVSGLVRAQMGASVSSTVIDEDLDRHVAELILKEAKKKAEQYGKQGVSAYLPQSVHLLPSFP